ncbi:MAG: hypothetical protein JJ971_11380 [Balneolaceae bacterium]|nr:hypothetical protein [Balneolaceae bacterium]MBO6546149.1 hypothetical protein [Balneolaceae bacterium]MBO6648507.1 hypothetical protein [Balneolaceae bacterium]
MSKLLKLFFILFVLNSCTKSKSIQRLENPTSENSSLPRLFTDNTGTVFMSWVEQRNELATLKYSKFVDNKWLEPVVISESKEWFVNWADFPSVIAQNGGPVAAHWLKKIPGNAYSYNVEITAHSEGSFIDPIVPHTDNTATEHGFVSMNPVSDSSFYAIWLDGRNTSGGHGEHGDLSSAMTLRGAEISRSGTVMDEQEIDPAICDCCNTSITNSPGGLLAVYRDRTEEEIRDVYITKMENGTWNKPKAVFNDHWEIAACPVNGPSIDSFNSTVAVAWYTGANNNPAVKLAFSADEGNSFFAPILIDTKSSLGRVDVLMNDEHSAWISWMSRTEESAQLNLQLVSQNGEIKKSHIVSAMSPSRSSGFPQITRTKDGVLIAWTDHSESEMKVNTAILR